MGVFIVVCGRFNFFKIVVAGNLGVLFYLGLLLFYGDGVLVRDLIYYGFLGGFTATNFFCFGTIFYLSLV
jgi:hypothetical protein